MTSTSVEASASSGRRPRLQVSFALFLLTLFTTLVYYPGLSGPFVFDDHPNILTNPKVHAQSLDLPTLERAATAYEPGSIGRPLATISFAVDYYLGKVNPRGYKITSLIVHLANAFLVFFLLRSVMRLPRAASSDSVLFCFTIALLWAIHPLQISTVLYIVQRMETLSLTFVLIGLIAYLKGRVQQRDGGRGWPWLVASALLAGLGLLSKETAALFPVYAFALELTVLRFDAQAPATRRLLKWAYAALSVAATIMFLGWVLPQYTADAAFAGRDFNLHERLLSQLRILPMYLGQMLLPLPGTLSFYYDDFVKSTGLLDPVTTLLGGLLLLALLGTGWRLRTRRPLVALGIFWFFGAHLLTSNVINLELAFEHRNYFALLGVLLAVGDLVRTLPMRDGPGLKRVAVGAIVLVLGALGAIRAATWGNELLMATEMVADNPQSPRASNDLAALYIALSGSDPASPFYSVGQQEFERGSRLPNASPLPEQGLILMAATTGQPVKDEWWTRLIHKVETRPVSPQEVMAVTGLLKQRYEGLELDDRRLAQAYQALLDRGPQPAHMYAQFGDYALKYLNDQDLADAMFLAAINRLPGDRDYAERILAALITDGHDRQARLVLARGVELGLFEAQHSN